MRLDLFFPSSRLPEGLKRLVGFLNAQMKSSEVVVVEARLYRSGNTKIVVPRLFGFSEEARAIRRDTIIRGRRTPVAADWDGFATNAAVKGLEVRGIDQCRLLYDACKGLNADIAWGRGTVTATFSPKWKSLDTTAAPFSVYATGLLELHLSSMQASEKAAAFAHRLSESLGKVIELPPNHMTTWYQCQRSEWMPNWPKFLSELIDLRIRESPTYAPPFSFRLSFPSSDPILKTNLEGHRHSVTTLLQKPLAGPPALYRTVLRTPSLAVSSAIAK